MAGDTAITCPCPALQDWCLWAALCWGSAGAVWPHAGDGVRRTPPRCRRRTGSALSALKVPTDPAQDGKAPSLCLKDSVPQGCGAEQQLRGCWMIQVGGRQSLPPRRRKPQAPCAALPCSLVTQPRAASCSAPRHRPTVPPASSPRRAGVSPGCSEAAARKMLSLRSRSAPPAPVALSHRVTAPSCRYLPGVAA